MTTEAITCHRCDRPLDPERVDLDGWLVLDAREDGWMLVVCPDCQTPSASVSRPPERPSGDVAVARAAAIP